MIEVADGAKELDITWLTLCVGDGGSVTIGVLVIGIATVTQINTNTFPKSITDEAAAVETDGVIGRTWQNASGVAGACTNGGSRDCGMSTTPVIKMYSK